jgi:hypothetical protein
MQVCPYFFPCARKVPAGHLQESSGKATREWTEGGRGVRGLWPGGWEGIVVLVQVCITYEQRSKAFSGLGLEAEENPRKKDRVPTETRLAPSPCRGS